MQNLHVVIIGAGIGGLTAAIALKRVGFTATVYERAAEIQALGAGISLWPNALKALERLGLSKQVSDIGASFGAGMMRTRRGSILINSLSPEFWLERYGSMGVAVHRAELHRVLLAALDDDAVYLGKTCTGYRQDAESVTALFEDGTEARGDLLIGADGIKSALRKQLLGDTPLRYSGYTAWRGVAPYKLNQIGASESWGRGARFGLVPLSENRTYWFATANAPEGEKDPPERKNAVMARFRGWHDPIEAVLEATLEASLLRNDIYDRLPAPRWSEGRVTLLGDAAHPMTPNMGQGACQAIEDAVIFASCLQNSPDISAALRDYEARRIPRTSAIVQQSWQFGRMGQWENPLACGLRNILVRLTPAGAMTKQLDPILRFEG